jgi:hypothetical protein
MRLQDVLTDLPKIHEGGRLANDALHFIDSHIDGTSTTLETCAGVSTILFALKHAAHTCVTPDPAQIDRIHAYCERHDIGLDSVRFELGRSEDVLPRLTMQRLDLVLIDGRHGFPTPFIDWYYTSNALRIGGLLVIDDVQLWTGNLLKQFLEAEPEWRLEKDFFPRALVFRKLAEGSHSKSWTEQPLLVRRTAAIRRVDRIRHTARRARRAAELMRSAPLRTLGRVLLGWK